MDPTSDLYLSPGWWVALSPSGMGVSINRVDFKPRLLLCKPPSLPPNWRNQGEMAQNAPKRRHARLRALWGGKTPHRSLWCHQPEGSSDVLRRLCSAPLGFELSRRKEFPLHLNPPQHQERWRLVQNPSHGLLVASFPFLAPWGAVFGCSLGVFGDAVTQQGLRTSCGNSGLCMAPTGAEMLQPSPHHCVGLLPVPSWGVWGCCFPVRPTGWDLNG